MVDADDAARRAARGMLPLRGGFSRGGGLTTTTAAAAAAAAAAAINGNGIPILIRVIVATPPTTSTFHQHRASYATITATHRNDDDERPGVYGLEGLHHPEDFERLAVRAVAKSEDMVSALVRTTSSQSAAASSGVIDDLDEISGKREGGVFPSLPSHHITFILFLQKPQLPCRCPPSLSPPND